MDSEQTIASLQIRVESLEAKAASERLDDLSNASGKTGTALGKLAKLAGLATAAFAAFRTVMSMSRNVVQAQREYDILTTRLQGVTGSVQAARQAFLAFDELEAQMPFNVAQLTDAYVTLRTTGLEATKESMTDMANLSIALGKDIGTTADMISKAAMGQFRSLTSLGIEVRETNDSLVVSMLGRTQVLEKSGEALVAYLRDVGRTDFGGLALQQMDTMDGLIRKLEDSWGDFYRELSESGAGDKIRDVLRLGLDALDELRGVLQSGELQTAMSAIGAAIEPMGLAFKSVFGTITDSAEDSAIDVGIASGILIQTTKSVTTVLNVMQKTILYYRELVGSLTEASRQASARAEVTERFKNIVQQTRKLTEEEKAHFATIIQGEQGVGEALEFFYARREKLGENFIGYVQRHADVYSKAVFGIVQAKQARIDEYNAIRESETAVEALTKKIIAQAKARKAAQDAGTVTSGGNELPAGGSAPPTRRVNDDDLKAYQALEASLVDSYALMEREYARQVDLVARVNAVKLSTALAATKDLTDAERATVTEAFNKQTQEELRLLDMKYKAELVGGETALLLQNEMLKRSYRERTRIIEESTTAESEERKRLLEDLQAQEATQQIALQDAAMEQARLRFETEQMLLMDALYAKDIAETEFRTRSQANWQKYQEALINLGTRGQRTLAEQHLQNYQNTLQHGQQLMGALTQLAGESSKTGRALFQANKVIAIAQATISTYQGASKALEAGYPMGYINAALIIATGMANVANITSQQPPAAYEHGGMIPAGQFGLVGEAGAELVRGPAMVTSARTTADMLRGGGEASTAAGRGDVNINVINQVDGATVETNETTEEDGSTRIDLIVKRVKNEVAADIKTGGTGVARAIEGTYKLRR